MEPKTSRVLPAQLGQPVNEFDAGAFQPFERHLQTRVVCFGPLHVNLIDQPNPETFPKNGQRCIPRLNIPTENGLFGIVSPNEHVRPGNIGRQRKPK